MIIVSLNKLNRLWKNGILPKLNEKVGNAKVLSNIEEIEANTDASNIAGALALKAVNNDLGGLSFAQDAEGNWGYKPSGADTVVPFKSLSASKILFMSGVNFKVTNNTDVYLNFKVAKGTYIVCASGTWTFINTSHPNGTGGIIYPYNVSGENCNINKISNYIYVVTANSDTTININMHNNYMVTAAAFLIPT